MPHVPHPLAEDFPGMADRLRRLQGLDVHFARICDEYLELNRAIHRAETGLVPTDDFRLAVMRRNRLLLKDKITARLARNDAAAEAPGG
ncbi:DUF465 domain-containing protein [Rhodobacteraceae bacterium 2CG4]|uniref:DUF465 domain-containing protein n=1 Tax=Halovulum marinum TaxID=2662447 RepID=A0A6L5Z7V0_9RHOB|nr:DUF465 domain-containing protein [Halovulum marinum]MSU92270.1 DUF465 domain-containing protein [Halovulum marinum]